MLSRGIDLDTMKTTHVMFLQNEHTSSSTIPFVPLPEVQPLRPMQWKVAVWNDRFVTGNSEFHTFASSRGGDLFVLKVSGSRDHNDRWVYETLDSHSEASVFDYLEQMQERLKSLGLPGIRQ